MPSWLNDERASVYIFADISGNVYIHTSRQPLETMIVYYYEEILLLHPYSTQAVPPADKKHHIATSWLTISCIELWQHKKLWNQNLILNLLNP